MWNVLHIVCFSQQFKHASWLVKHEWQSHWPICLEYFWSAIAQAIIFMKFRIRLDSDNIFNFNSYFVSGFIAIRMKYFRKEKILVPNSADKGKTLYWIGNCLVFFPVYFPAKNNLCPKKFGNNFHTFGSIKPKSA